MKYIRRQSVLCAAIIQAEEIWSLEIVVVAHKVWPKYSFSMTFKKTLEGDVVRVRCIPGGRIFQTEQ